MPLINKPCFPLANPTDKRFLPTNPGGPKESPTYVVTVSCIIPSPSIQRAGPAGGPSPLTHTVLPVPMQPPSRWADTLVAAPGVDTALLAAAVVHAALIHVWKHRHESEGRRGWEPPAQSTPMALGGQRAPRIRDQEAPVPRAVWDRSQESRMSHLPKGKHQLFPCLSFPFCTRVKGLKA